MKYIYLYTVYAYKTKYQKKNIGCINIETKWKYKNESKNTAMPLL